jgi:hypothetical protein
MSSLVMTVPSEKHRYFIYEKTFRKIDLNRLLEVADKLRLLAHELGADDQVFFSQFLKLSKKQCSHTFLNATRGAFDSFLSSLPQTYHAFGSYRLGVHKTSHKNLPSFTNRDQSNIAR